MGVKIVGVVTRLGYLRCIECRGDVEVDTEIHADSEPHAFEACDECGRQLATGLRWVKVAVRDDWPETWEAERDGEWLTIEKDPHGRGYSIGVSYRRGDVDSVGRGSRHTSLHAAQVMASRMVRS